MAKNTFFYQTSDVISSFTTKHPKVLVDRVPWVITMDTKMSDALNLVFDDGYADLLVLDPLTGSAVGLFSDFDKTTTLSSKKKKEKKATKWLELQGQCHNQCEAACASRGGCGNHGLADYGGGLLCVIVCADEGGSIGDVLDAAQTLPG